MSITGRARTNLGPLTAGWTQPPSCTVAIAACSTCSSGLLGQVCGRDTTVSDNTDCWPPRSEDDSIYTPHALRAWGFYSPAWECPAGYAAACSATGGGSTQFPFAFSLLPQETAVGCCPSGFACHIGSMGVQTCLGVATAPSIFQTAMCVDGKTRQYGVVTAPSSGASLYTRFAPMFQINHRTADLPSSSTSTAAAASEKPAHSQSRGLSTAVKAAIAAGASLVGIILTVVASLVIIYIRRQRTLKDRAQDASLVSSMEEVHSKNYIELRDVSHAQMPPDHGVATPGRVWDRSRHSI